MGRKNKKRTKSDASPDAVSTTDKRQALSYSDQSQTPVTHIAATMASPLSQSILAGLPPYVSPGHPYNVTQQQPMYMAPQTPVTAMPSMPSMQTYPGVNVSPTQTTQPPQQIDNSAMLQTIIEKLEKLDAVDRKLQKLESIECKLSTLSKQISSVDSRVTSLESSMKAQESKMSEIETSRAFDSQVCDEIRKKQTSIEKQLCEIKVQKENFDREQSQISQESARLSEDILDLQSRSMRDNLLFFGFDEATSVETRKTEDCVQIVHDFCTNTLGIENSSTLVKIDRAHRVGKFNPTKKRPIVAKFNYYQDKMSVKRLAREKLDNQSQYRIGDQYPKPIQDRRRKLVPIMIKAKNEGKRAYLSYDKLYVDGRLITADSVPDTAAGN